MSLNNIANLGVGGSGLSGTGTTTLNGAIKELQGFTQSVLTGTTANTTIALAAIRQEDTLIGALNNNAGTITDITANISINDVNATGTITCAAAAAADTVTVNAKVYTAVSGTPANNTQFNIAGSDTADAASLVAAINSREANALNAVTASNIAGVVTVRATAEGTGGNSITLASSNGTRLAVSGATLAGGTATGGIKSTSVTNQIILTWWNKR
jgi:hypothetical protein